MKAHFLPVLVLLFNTTNFDALAATAPPTTQEFDLQGFVDARLKAGEKRIILPAGRHRVAATKRGVMLWLKDLADVEIVGQGVEIVCISTGRVVVMDNCAGVKLKGLTVDFDPLPFTQGRIVALAPDKSWVEFEIIAGYPETGLKERVEIFDPATSWLRRETGGWDEKFEAMGNRRYRAHKPPRYRYREDWDTEQVGDIFVTANVSATGAMGHAFNIERCKGVVLEDITLYGSSSMGFVEHQSDGTAYLRCRIDRRPPENDPVKRGFPRMRSLNADAFHSAEAIKGPQIIGCTAKFQGDDCINIHGTYHLVTACTEKQLRIAAVHRLTIEPGDPVEFLPYEGIRPADAVAVKIESDGPITDAEKELVRKLSLHAPNKERLLAGQAKFFKLTLDRAVPLAMGSAVCSGKRVGNGFLVKDNDFGYNRSRGILIKASRGQVIGNRISHGWMAAVLVSPEFWWFESASSSDVEISGNVIVGCRRPAVEIVAPGGNGKPLPAGAHRNISIVNNTFTDSAWPNIRVTSTDGLTIRDNRLTPAEPRTFVPPVARPWNWKDTTPSPITTDLCEHTTVQETGSRK